MKNFARKVYRTFFKSFIENKLKPARRSFSYPHIRKQIKCEYKWLGNDYGGFYVNPTILNENSIIYSFGIGEDISFDNQIIENFDATVFGFDPTPKSIKWCAREHLPKKFNFYPFGIAKESGKTTFNLPVNPDHVSGSIIAHTNVNTNNSVEVDMKSFKDIINSLHHTTIDILKMDIEGSEYDVIESILKEGVKIPQLVVEFHERFFENGKQKTIDFIALMNKYGYKIFAISNSFQEVSFIKFT